MPTAPASAAPVYMTFAGLGAGAVTGPYTENGFVLTVLAGDLTNPMNNGSGNVQNDPLTGTGTPFAALSITTQSGNPFYFLSADVGNFNGNFSDQLISGSGPSEVYIQGDDGPSIAFSGTVFASSGSYSTQASIGPATPITQLIISLGGGVSPADIESVDNLYLEEIPTIPAPEPASLWLLGAGIATLLLRRRKTDRSSAPLPA